LRTAVHTIIARAEAGSTTTAADTAQEALRALDGGCLLATTEAAALLGVRSINAVKLWCWSDCFSSRSAAMAS